jgi:hypothetical protein
VIVIALLLVCHSWSPNRRIAIVARLVGEIKRVCSKWVDSHCEEAADEAISKWPAWDCFAAAARNDRAINQF